MKDEDLLKIYIEELDRGDNNQQKLAEYVRQGEAFNTNVVIAAMRRAYALGRQHND